MKAARMGYWWAGQKAESSVVMMVDTTAEQKGTQKAGEKAELSGYGLADQKENQKAAGLVIPKAVG
jgi:hypothetical protein